MNSNRKIKSVEKQKTPRTTAARQQITSTQSNKIVHYFDVLDYRSLIDEGEIYSKSTQLESLIYEWKCVSVHLIAVPSVKPTSVTDDVQLDNDMESISHNPNNLGAIEMDTTTNSHGQSQTNDDSLDHLSNWNGINDNNSNLSAALENTNLVAVNADDHSYARAEPQIIFEEVFHGG